VDGAMVVHSRYRGCRGEAGGPMAPLYGGSHRLPWSMGREIPCVGRAVAWVPARPGGSLWQCQLGLKAHIPEVSQSWGGH
jgi:hypothetical protein